jgi:hypothetical protein
MTPDSDADDAPNRRRRRLRRIQRTTGMEMDGDDGIWACFVANPERGDAAGSPSFLWP